MENNQFNNLPSHSPEWLINFVSIYQTLSTTNLSLLSKVYHSNVTFIDPLHKVEGFDNLFTYFENLYQNLSTCNFVIDEVLLDGDQASIYWTMSYQHNKLNKGEMVTVFGSSHIKGEDGKVIFHRDYLDLGSMLYEQLPLFGRLTKWIKAKAAT